MKNLNYLTLALLCSLGLTIAAFAETDASRSAKAEYDSALKIYTKGDYETSIRMLLSLQAQVVKARDEYEDNQLAQIQNLLGLSYLATKKTELAINQLKLAQSSADTDSFRGYASFNLAAAVFETGKTEETLQILSTVKEKSLDRENQLKAHSLKFKALMKVSKSGEAARELLEITMIATNLEANRKTYTTLLEQALNATSDVNALETLVENFDRSTFVDLVYVRLARVARIQANSGSAERAAKEYVKRYPNGAFAPEALEIIKIIEAESIVAPNTVGVLLPLSGKYAKVGYRSLQAIQLAFRVFNLRDPDSKVTLVIQDAGETEKQTLDALTTLYQRHHVSAVIGPMTSKGIDSVSARAKELGLPMISLAQQPSSTGGDYVFQGGMTPLAQSSEIARYAVEKLGFKRFSILHPRDKYGEQYSKSFWDSVEALGGEIVGIESYAPGETDVREAVDRLVGLYYTDARKREIEELARERLAKDIKKRTRKTEQFYALQPIVDFDAVFIPDEPKAIGQILPTFAYRDVVGIKFLGTAAWNSPDLAARAQSYAERALFTDAFFPISQSPHVKKFMTLYRSTYTQEPGGIEALAYDAASLIEAVISQAGKSAPSRSDILEYLKNIKQFPGVTGSISNQSGYLTRNLTILTVKAGEVVEVK